VARISNENIRLQSLLISTTPGKASDRKSVSLGNTPWMKVCILEEFFNELKYGHLT
jgi:hypothetical protein